MKRKTALNPENQRHTWRFLRMGGVDQVILDSEEDLLHLGELDQKLWVALSCPTTGLEFDERTLHLIDTDGDGRIRPPELIAAVRWIVQRLDRVGSLFSPEVDLPLDAISRNAPQGEEIVSAAQRILRSLRKPDATAISVSAVSRAAEFFAKMPFNGDGVVPPSSALDSTTKQLLRDIIATVGGVPDRSGEPGVNESKLREFYQELQNFRSWWQEGEGSGQDGTVERLPLGEHTPVGYLAYARVKGKINDFFNRCRLSAFDARATSHLNRTDSDYVAIAGNDLSTLPAELAERPIAAVLPDAPLPLATGVNPTWTNLLRDFQQRVVNPLLGERDHLPLAEWQHIQELFRVYESWILAKKGSSVEKLGLPRIEEILQGTDHAKVEELLAEDMRLSGEAAALQDLERLARYHRDLIPLTRNFISFFDFYSITEKAVFQAGTLYLDNRSCALCVHVNDPGVHATLANLSRCYLAYCECRRANETPIRIAAVFSNGDSDSLMIGRNGVFYDRKGRDWDATIVRILDNPISIRQAFWAPYKKFARFLDEQMARRAALADEATTQRLSAAAENTAQVGGTAQSPTGAATKPPVHTTRRIEVGTVAALGVALGSIGTFLTVIFLRIIEFGPWLPFAILGIILAISFPSMFLAWIKLRQRTLGPMLDASGWAINARLKIGVTLARNLTGVRQLPPGAKRDLIDALPGEQQRPRRIRLAMLAILLLALLGFLYSNLL